MARAPEKFSNLLAKALTIGAGGTKLGKVLVGTVDVNPASLATLTSGETTVTITGAAVGDIVVMNVPASLETGLAFSGARVSAADTVAVRLTNVTAGSVDGANRTWGYMLVKKG